MLLFKLQYNRIEILLIIIPCLATITLETASGTDVPAAKNVIPITESGIFKVSPEIQNRTCQNELLHKNYFKMYIFTYDGYHPCDQIRKRSNPYNAHQKCQRKPTLETWLFTIWYSESKY